MAATDVPGIEKTPNVCGGDARVGNHRITVRTIVHMRKLGATDAELLESYPLLTPADLTACWEYYRRHPVEIEQEIWLNDTSANVPPGESPPAGVIIAGKLLGLSDEEVIEAFDEPITAADIAAAWEVYLAAPARVERELADLRWAS